MVRYPHIVIITPSASKFEKDANHNLKPVGSSEPYTSKCKATPADEYKAEIKGDDGNKVNYSFSVSMPKVNVKYGFGSKVSLYLEGEEVVECELKRQFNGQKNTMLWV